MIVFASNLRHARRQRRIPSVASVVRVLGTVRVSDQPDDWTPGATRTSPSSSTRSASIRSASGLGAAHGRGPAEA